MQPYELPQQQKVCFKKPKDYRGNGDSKSYVNNTYDEEKHSISECDLSSTTQMESLQPAHCTSPLIINGRRVFTTWVVKLNNENQLVIEGLLECGRRARSKPIAARLDSSRILSKFKHLYYLVGNMSDLEYVPPEFVRQKFHSGFPEDWEDVVEIWKKFATLGSCSETMSVSRPEYLIAEEERSHQTINDIKRLRGWTPLLVPCETREYSLVFKGTLLSSTGHAVNNHYVTGIVHKRICARIVETVNQEFYELIGDINNTKRDVPKELVLWCRNGCPKRIRSFCEKWAMLKNKEIKLKTHPLEGKSEISQDQRIPLAICNEKTTNVIRYGWINSSSMIQLATVKNKRKRLRTELDDSRINRDIRIDNNKTCNGESGATLIDDAKSRESLKVNRTAPSDLPGTHRENVDVEKGENLSINEQVRSTAVHENERRPSPLKIVPTLSYVYHRSAPLPENILSDVE